MRPRVTLFVPTLNEEEGMRLIMPRVRPDWVDQVLVVDGGSRDGTVAYARERGYDVVVQRRRGLRHAYTEGLPSARGDVIITFSPDGNCIPEDIPKLTARLDEGCDMVIASRYIGGMRSEDDDWLTRLGNSFFRRLISTLHGGSLVDPMTIYRAWWKPLFYHLDLDRDRSYFQERWFNTVMGVEQLMTVRALKAGLQIAEIPSPEPARIAGVRKLQVIRWGLAYATQIVMERFVWEPPRTVMKRSRSG